MDCFTGIILRAGGGQPAFVTHSSMVKGDTISSLIKDRSVNLYIHFCGCQIENNKLCYHDALLTNRNNLNKRIKLCPSCHF